MAWCSGISTPRVLRAWGSTTTKLYQAGNIHRAEVEDPHYTFAPLGPGEAGRNAFPQEEGGSGMTTPTCSRSSSMGSGDPGVQGRVPGFQACCQDLLAV